MNIKSKLIEQLSILEEIQLKAKDANQFRMVLDYSKAIMDYIRTIDMEQTREEEYDDDECICPECMEELMHEQLINDIAVEANLPTAVVRAVITAQDEVLGMDEDTPSPMN